MTERERLRILVVDDEPDLHELVVLNLAEAGFEARSEQSGRAALIAVETFDPIALVLDLMLPDLSGIEICRRLRESGATRDLGVLMLTARSDSYDRVLGFESGADDYVAKPFDVREVVLRVQALSRRVLEGRHARGRATGPRLTWNGISMDVSRHQVFLDGVEQPLRPLEFKLLSLLLQRPERTFSRKDLLEAVWGITADVQTRTVESHVRRLRERLGVHAGAVETVPGFGYRLRKP